MDIQKIAAKIIQSSRKEVYVKTIQLKLVDFWDDPDEPAFDLEVWIDGKPLEGGAGVFMASKYEDKHVAAIAATKALNGIVKEVERLYRKSG